ncbi:GerMN domain-containing protein [Mycoplasmatota bacterium]|nr:GerMN domain-containing protein [Mycoplasmatota bacterium]
MRKITTGTVIIIVITILCFLYTRPTYEVIYYNEDIEESVLYLLENDLLVKVPVAVNDDIEEIFELMTTKANNLPTGVRTPLPYRLEIKTWENVDGSLLLELENFDYDNLNLVIESLTWTYLELDDINEITVIANGVMYEQTKDLGINKIVEASTILNSKIVTVFTQNKFVTPISYIVDMNVDEIDYIVKKTLKKDVEKIIENDDLLVYLNESLDNENNLSNLVLTLRNSFNYDNVKIFSNGELLYSIKI